MISVFATSKREPHKNVTVGVEEDGMTVTYTRLQIAISVRYTKLKVSWFFIARCVETVTQVRRPVCEFNASVTLHSGSDH
jgi:hypothetical protein